MSEITTTNDWKTWRIREDLHTTQELLDYITDLTFDADHVRKITLNMSTPSCSVNSLSVCTNDFEYSKLLRNAVGVYGVNRDVPVKNFWYYTDRGKVEVEYDHHPCDPKPNNTLHDVSEFKDMFEKVFEVWQERCCCELQERIDSKDAPPETPFNPSEYYEYLSNA